MKVGTTQLICLGLGVLFLSLGGGMLGGRLAAEKQRQALPEQSGRPTDSAAAPEKREASKPAPQETSPVTPAVSEEDGPSEVFDLYSSPITALAERQPLAKKDAPASPGESPADTPVKYVIQAVSTSDMSDARASRKKIMAAGFPAGVVEVDLPGKGTWYRVYIGPYETESEARLKMIAIRDIPGFSESFLKALD